MANRNNFMVGIGVVPASTSTNSVLGDIETLISTGKIQFHNGVSNSPIVTEVHASQGANRLQNKDLDAASSQVVDGSDTTKALGITLSGATASTKSTLVFSQTANRTITFFDANDTVVGRNTVDTLTNKSIDGNNNTITNIGSGSLPSDVVYLNAIQTVTNKTLTSPKLNTATADTITGITGGALSLQAASGQNVLVNSIVFNSNSITGGASSQLSISAATNQDIQITAANPGKIKFNNSVMVDDTTQSLTLNSNTRLQLNNATNSSYVGLAVPSVVNTNYVITLPANNPTANTALVFNGSNYVWGQAGGWSTFTSTSLTGGGTVSISTTIGQQMYVVAGASGAVTLSNTPFGASPPVGGAVIRLIGNSNTNTVSIVNNDAANGCIVNGTPVLYKYDVIEFQYSSSLSRYIETFRNF